MTETAAGFAFATSEDAATVTAIEIAARRAVAVLPAGPGAHSIAIRPDRSRLAVVNRTGGSVTIVDPRGLSVLATIALDADPMGAAISPDGETLAVLGRTRLVLWLIDLAAGRIRAAVHLAAPGERDDQAGGPGGPPCSTHPVWLSDGVTVLAQDNVHARLVAVDTVAASVTHQAPLPSPAHMLYSHPDGRLFALCTGSDRDEPPSVAVQHGDGSLLAAVPIPLADGESGELHHAALDSGGQRLYVANMGRGRPRTGRSVHVLDTGSLRLVTRLEARAGAGHPLLSPDGRRLWVVNHSSPVVSIFDTDTLEAAGEVALPGAGSMGHGCFFAEEGASFWAVSNSAGAVYCIDTARIEVVAVIPTGPNSQDIAHAWGDAFA